MKIDVSSIRFDLGAVLQADRKVKMDDLVLQSRTVELPEPLHLELQVTNTGDTFIATGMLHARTVVECNRCLEKFVFPMEIAFFEEIPKEGLIDEKMIDLTDSIYEHIMLELPIKTLCNEDCKGLCLQCGQNLNIQDCGCDRQVVDPRLVKLQEYFKKE